MVSTFGYYAGICGAYDCHPQWETVHSGIYFREYGWSQVGRVFPNANLQGSLRRQEIREMEAVAKSRFVRQSAKKVRRTLGLIRGRDVETALNLLHFAPQKASVVIEKTIHSAVANYLQSDSTEDRDADDLFVKEAYVDEGPTMRRFRPASMGRASRIRKRSSHLTVVVSQKN